MDNYIFCAHRASLKANREDHQQSLTKSKKNRDKRRHLLCLATPTVINLGQGLKSLYLWIYLAHYIAQHHVPGLFGDVQHIGGSLAIYYYPLVITV